MEGGDQPTACPWIEDSLYLLHDVYSSVDADGPLRPYEAAARQQERVSSLAADAPSSAYLRALLQVQDALAADAAVGDLELFHERLLGLRQDEIFFPAMDRCFVEALLHGQLHVAEYMRRRGYPLPPIAALLGARGATLHRSPDALPVLKPLVTKLVGRWLLEPDEWDEDGNFLSADHKVYAEAVWRLRQHWTSVTTARISSAPAGAPDFEGAARYLAGALQATLAHLGILPRIVVACGDTGTPDACSPMLPAPPAVVILYAVLVCSADVNHQREPDLYTALHLAAVDPRIDILAALLCAGADVNAIAADESTPTSVAAAGTRASDGGSRLCDVALSFLRSHGGVEDWKAAMHTNPATTLCLSLRTEHVAVAPPTSSSFASRPAAERARPAPEMATFSGAFNPTVAARAFADARGGPGTES